MKQKRTELPLFNPDKLASTICSSLNRDINASQKYSIDPQATEFFKNAQKEALFKKYRSKRANAQVTKIAAIDKFINVNAAISSVNYGLNNFDFTVDTHLTKAGKSRHPGSFIQVARGFISEVLGDIDLHDIFEASKNSGGTSLGVPYWNTSGERKFRYPLTSTPTCTRLFDLYLSWDPQLKNALDGLNQHNCAPRYQIVEASRLTTVPKNDKIDRTIAIEPTVNMFFQQGAMVCMYERLKLFGFDLSQLPQQHGAAAWLYSLTRKGSTIDFSSASDSISLALVELLFPPSWCWVFKALRCPYAQVGEDRVSLSMISTMGNATTFPIETVILLSFIAATEALQRQSTMIDYKKIATYSVFGDDCILETTLAPSFIRWCEFFGFSVNDEKSYYSGCSSSVPFRESCGYDYLRGRNVRPYYLGTPVDSSVRSYEAWLYNIWNGCLKKYIEYFGNRTYCYQSLFQTLIDEMNRMHILVKCVPDYFPDDSGIKINNDPRLLLQIKSSVKYLSPLYDDRHGSIKFSYLRFSYNEDRRRFALLRLWYSLKFRKEPDSIRIIEGKSRPVDEILREMFKVRRKGGYKVTPALPQSWMSKETLSVLYFE